jgi:type VI secretion system secreted protein Hcp
MAMDIHLDLQKGSINGESQEKGFEKQIQVLSWSWGATQTGSFAHGAGGGAGKVSMQDFHFTMQMCTASPALFMHCATGQHISQAILTARKSGQKTAQQKFLVINFYDLLISSYNTGGANASDGLPTESVSFNYSKIDIEYFVQDAKGVTKSAGKNGYDLQKNHAY